MEFSRKRKVGEKSLLFDFLSFFSSSSFTIIENKKRKKNTEVLCVGEKERKREKKRGEEKRREEKRREEKRREEKQQNAFW
ncbi:unnamed protein product [Arabidopsis lyrata]|nr:unnamed protein product [Arabidopsis lyrata]